MRPIQWVAAAVLATMGLAAGTLIAAYLTGLFGDAASKATIDVGIAGIAGVCATIFANGAMTRRRDERLHEEARRAMAAALGAELHHLERAIRVRSDLLHSGSDLHANVAPYPRTPIYDTVGAQVGLLGHEWAERIVELFCYGEELSAWFEQDRAMARLHCKPEFKVMLDNIEVISASLRRVAEAGDNELPQKILHPPNASNSR